jgi:hypothetical protein
VINSSDFSRSNAQVIKYPIITDKATRLLENNQYSFIVIVIPINLQLKLQLNIYLM